MMASSSSSNPPDPWALQADLYASKAACLTEMHGADLVTILKNEILRAKTILDVGCGTGAFLRAYVQQFPRGVPGQTLISTDLSESMLQKAKEVVLPGGGNTNGFQTNLVFQQEDGSKLEGIADDSVDMVVSLFGVFLIPDQDATLHAITRVLKKDKSGVFANASWMFGTSDYLSSRGFGVSLQDVFKLPNDMIGSKNPSDASILQWSSIHGVSNILKNYVTEANLRCYSVIHNTVWEFDTLWTMMTTNPMSALQTASEEDVVKAKQALRDFVTQKGEVASLEEPITLSTVSILAIARGFGE